MANITEFSKTVSNLTMSASGKITIKSPGWSGKVIRRDAQNDEDREFMLNVSLTTHSEEFMWSGSGRGSGGYTPYDQHGSIIGISLEHFGPYPVNDPDDNGGVQCLGEDANRTLMPSWGASELDSALVEGYYAIYLKETSGIRYHEQGGHEPDEYSQSNISIFWAEAIIPNWKFFDVPVSIYGNWQANTHVNIETDLPIFNTDADLLEYCQSGGLIIDKMLNKSNPQDAYNKDLDCWFVNNVWGHNTKNRADYTDYRNYQFYPYNVGKICFYQRNQSSLQPYDLGLLQYTDYTVMSAPAFSSNYSEYSGSVHSNYISKSCKFGSDDYYSVFGFQTNIPIFESFEKALDYIHGDIPITDATNYVDITRDSDTEIPPEFGIEDEATDIGTNGQAYNIAGFHLYEVSHTELSSFFLEIFDVAHIQDILDGTKLFSGNEINAIMSCMYLPISDLSEVCEMGATSKISVASWTADHSEGRRIAKNNLMIDMGSVYIPDRYGDERCYEPFQTLVLQAPYCGFYTLQCSKYVGHVMSIKYAVSVADGSCRCLVFSDGILLDSFTGSMGSMRPISDVDQAQYVSNVVNGVMNSGSSIASGLGKMADTAMVAGGPTGAMVGMAGGVTAQGVYKGFELLQAVDTPPMTTHGAITPNLGYFGPQKCHLIVAQKASVRPQNEQLTIGYPSGQGGKISSFSGFLACKSVMLADGFTGSEEERSELIGILEGGIYL